MSYTLYKSNKQLVFAVFSRQNKFCSLLWLLNLHFLPAHPTLSSVYKFKKILATGKSPVVKHFYCNFCMSPVHEHMTVCPNAACLNSLSDSKSKSFFLEISVIAQLKNMFQK